MDEYGEIVARVYMQQTNTLKWFGLWHLSPNKPWFLKFIYRIYFWYFLIFWILLFDLLMVMQIIININSIEEILNVIFMFATAIAVLVKFLTVKMKNQSLEVFFTAMANEEYLPKNAEERTIFLNCVDLNIKVRNLYAIISYAALSLFLLGNLLDDSDELPMSVYMPIDLNTKWKFNLVYTYMCFALSTLCFFNVAFDTLSSSFFIHLKGQLDILGHRLENIGRHSNYSQLTVMYQLKECVRCYNRILNMAHDIEFLVSKANSSQIACSVFVLIANFYSMASLSNSGDMVNLIKMAIYQACMLSQIFILCYYGNEISLKSSEISFNLYKSDWYNWNKINRKLVLLMMLRFELPIRIATINRCYSFNLPAFTSIVNSSYSYFALLKRSKS